MSLRKLKKKTHKDHRKPQDLSPLEQICEWMSLIFHQESLSPDYQIVIYSNHGREWGTVPMDGPIKQFNDFFKVRIAHYFKKNLFYKAQRAHQSELISKFLGNLIYHRINSNSLQPLVHKGKEITKVFIQTITVAGHKTHRLDEIEYLVPSKHEFEIIRLEDNEGTPIYVDLCAPQIDICVYGTNDKPLLILDSGKFLNTNKPYSPEHKQFVKIIKIGASQEITGDDIWNDFQDILIRNSVNIYDFSTLAKDKKKREEENKKDKEEESCSSSEENSYQEEKHEELMKAIEEMRKYMNEKIYNLDKE